MKMNNYLKASILCGFIVLSSTKVIADFVHQDDVIIVGSVCIGMDCNNGESFNFDTIRLKENNVRIKFQDTSSTSSFPSRDWEIVANDSSNGGLNKFSIVNADAGQTPFTILDGVGNDALYIRSTNRVGFGTSAPSVNLHVVDGNSPTLRLEQDSSGGFASQAWDVGGNETNFFVRDITNGSRIPFKIQPSAPVNSLFVANDGDIGFSTQTPDGLFDIAHPADLNDHAVLVNTAGYFGVNIDNGYGPLGLIDVQTTGGKSKFLVSTTGNVGFGTNTPVGRFDIKDLADTKSYFNIDSDGDVGIGTNTPNGRFDITDAAGSNTLFTIADDGSVAWKSSYLDSDTTSCADYIQCGSLSPIMTLEETNSSTNGRMLLKLKNNAPAWLGFENTVANTQWYMTNSPNGLTFAYADLGNNSIEVPLQLRNNGDVEMAGTLYSSSSIHLKENIESVNEQRVLELVDKLNIYSWNYIKNEDDEKHIGPMAQDFYRLFGTGMDDEHISSIDTNGVSLAAIRALYTRLKELELKIKTIENKN